MNSSLKTMVRVATVPLLLIAAAAFTQGARADVVILRTGDKVVGIVRDIPTEPEKALLITATGEVVIPRRQILRLTEEPDSTGYRRIAEVHMERALWEPALKALEQASESDPPDSEVPRLLATVRERLLQESLSKLEAQNNLNRERLDEVEDAVAAELFQKAQELLESVSATSPTTEIRARWTRLSASLEVSWGLDREDKLDYSGAAAHFQQALVFEPGNQTAIDRLLKIWAEDPTRRAEVIEGYKRKFELDPNDLLSAQKLADLHVAEGQLQEALPYLRAVVASGKIRGMGYEDRLATAYNTLSTQAAEQRDFDRAIMLYSEYLKMQPGAEARPLHYFEYLKRYEQLDPADIQGRLDLAEFLKDKGLDTQALQDIQAVLDKEPRNQKALQLLRDYALVRLEEVRLDFQQNRHAMAMAGARELTQDYTALPDIVEQASDIYARAEIEMKRAERERVNQARELVALGDQYYQQAYFYANQMKTTERDPGVRVISYRQEAIKFARRAMQAYNQAISIDPDVRSMPGGDVANKLRDLNQLYSTLTGPPIPIPRITGRYGTKR